MNADFEDEIGKLSLADPSTALDARMEALFVEDRRPVHPPIRAGRNLMASSFLLAASLLLGFGAGVWYATPVDRQPSSTDFADNNAATLEQDSAVDPAYQVSSAIPPTSINALSKRTVVSPPLWIRSTDGQLFRSYLTSTQENTAEVGSGTILETTATKTVPRLVITNTPGI